MINYQALLIADTYLKASEDISLLLMRMDADITNYKQQPNPSDKAIAIRIEQLTRIYTFLNASEAIVQQQKTMLEKYQTLQARHTDLLNQYKITKCYAKQLANEKGLSNQDFEDVLRFNTLKDFK